MEITKTIKSICLTVKLLAIILLWEGNIRLASCQTAPDTVLSTKGVESFTYILPRPYKPMELKTVFTIMFTRLPIDWVETSVDVPIFQIGARLGMPAGFTIDGSLQSIYVANQIRLGPHYNMNIYKFRAGLGFEGSFMYGKMTISDFDNKATGWSAYPNISLGFNAGSVAFTFTAELNILLSLKITSGDAEISRQKNYVAGKSFALYMEQRLWKNHVLILGAVNNFQKFFYPAWPAFSAFARQYYIPQFYIGLVL